MITLTVSAHYSRMSLTNSLVIKLSNLGTLVHDSLWLYTRFNSSESSWALQTIPKLWIMQWACVKCLLIDWSTRSIDNTLSCINVTWAILYKNSTTTSHVILFSTFSICRLCTVDIYIVLWVLNILKSALIRVILHLWMICWLTSSSWFTRFLRSTSWLSGWVRSWISNNKSFIWDALKQWIIVRPIHSSLRNYGSPMRATIDLMLLRSFHLNLLELFMKFQLLLMLRWWRKACSIIDMTTSRCTVLTNYWLLGLLKLLIKYLRISLMTWNMHSFSIWIMTLDQNILVWIRVFPREKSTLSLSFPPFFNHSFLWSWAFTFGYMTYSFEITNHMMKTLTLLYRWLILLLS